VGYDSNVGTCLGLPRSSLLPVLVLAVTLGACRSGCDPDPLGGVPPGTSSPLAAVSRPPERDVEALWKRASDGLQIETLAKPTHPPRYQVRACPLRYQVRTKQMIDVAPGRPQTGMRADLMLNADRDAEREGRFVLRLHQTHLSRLAEGRREDLKRQLSATFAPVWLNTDGRTWSEEDGPTSLWSAFGTFPGMLPFFPALPEGVAPGSETAWQIVTNAQRSTVRVERRRGNIKRKILHGPAIKSQTDTARVRVSHSLRLRPGKVAPWQTATVLVVDWTVERHTNPPRPRDQLERWLGHYVLLDSGRLLHAAIVGNKLHRWSVRPGEENEKRGGARFEMRLIEACDGVVLPPLPED
jgi:hypothetical protein